MLDDNDVQIRTETQATDGVDGASLKREFIGGYGGEGGNISPRPIRDLECGRDWNSHNCFTCPRWQSTLLFETLRKY